MINKWFVGMPDDLTKLHRLVTDSRMKRVWKELLRQKPQDKALVEFFDDAFQLARFPHFVTTPKDRAALAAPWAKAAELCRTLKEISIAVRTNPQSAAAVDQTAQLLEQQAAWWQGKLNSPRIVKQHGGDDVGRAYVRMLGHTTRKLFRSPMYRTVATAASVALDRKIGWLQVRDWTKL